MMQKQKIKLSLSCFLTENTNCAVNEIIDSDYNYTETGKQEKPGLIDS